MSNFDASEDERDILTSDSNYLASISPRSIRFVYFYKKKIFKYFILFKNIKRNIKKARKRFQV